MTPLGKRIQERRDELGLTLAALAEQAQMLPQTINAIERGGSRQPRYENLARLADALDLPLDELAKLAYAPQPHPAETVPA